MRHILRIPGLARWLGVVAWALVIFGFSAQPDLRFAPDTGLDFIIRKTGHMGVFGILALLVLWALAAGTRRRAIWIAAWGGATLYAVSDEFHQGFTSGRHPAVTDVAIDSAGAAIALGVAAAAIWLLTRRRRAIAA